MHIQSDEETAAGVNLSPLIDCVFLLLIFFLVATMIKKEDKDISIDLPASESAVQLRPDDNVLVLGIDAESKLYFEGAPSTLTQLHENLRHIAVASPDTRIRLDADAVTPIHRVIEVLDICQFRGLHNVGIRTYDESYNRR